MCALCVHPGMACVLFALDSLRVMVSLFPCILAHSFLSLEGRGWAPKSRKASSFEDLGILNPAQGISTPVSFPTHRSPKYRYS